PAAPPTSHPAPIPPKGIFDVNTPATFSGVSAAADDGLPLIADSFIAADNFDKKVGLYALRKTDLFNLLCIPPYMPDGSIEEGIVDTVAAYCEARRAMFLIDPPPIWATLDGGQLKVLKDAGAGTITGIGAASKNA